MSDSPNQVKNRDPADAPFRDRLVEAERKAPGAAALLSLAAFFAPDDIPVDLFQQEAALYPDALAQVVPDEARLAALLAVLADHALIDFAPQARTFSISSAAQAEARDALGPERDAWAQRAVGMITAAFPEPAPETWEQCGRLVPHVRALDAQLPADAATRDRAWLLGAAGAYLGERGALADALPLLEASCAVFERLAAANPGSAGAQRNFAVSHQRVGDALQAQNDRRGALKAHRAALAIFERLAAADSGRAGSQRDLAVSQERIGDVLRAQGDRRAALAAYQAGLTIFDRLAAADPGNTGLQHDLAVSQEKLGDALQAQGDRRAALAAYQAGLTIREALATAEPGDAGSQRDLSVTHLKIGDALAAQGDLPAALAAYQAALTIREGLAAGDPANAAWQHAIALNHGRIGMVHIRQGERRRALAAFRKGRETLAALLKADPGQSSLPGDVAWFNGQIAFAGFRSFGAKLRILATKLLVAAKSRSR